MVSAGKDIEAIAEQFFGELRGDAEAAWRNFQPLATLKSIFSEATMSGRWRATIPLPGEAKMSPMKRRLVKNGKCELRSAPLSRPSPRHLTPNSQGGVLRAPSGFSMAVTRRSLHTGANSSRTP